MTIANGEMGKEKGEKGEEEREQEGDVDAAAQE